MVTITIHKSTGNSVILGTRGEKVLKDALNEYLEKTGYPEEEIACAKRLLHDLKG